MAAIIYPVNCDDCQIQLKRGDTVHVSRSEYAAQGWHVQCVSCHNNLVADQTRLNERILRSWYSHRQKRSK